MALYLRLTFYLVCCAGAQELRLRSQVVQRDYPRPVEVNKTVLRPAGPNDPQLSELQKVPTHTKHFQHVCVRLFTFRLVCLHVILHHVFVCLHFVV